MSDLQKLINDVTDSAQKELCQKELDGLLRISVKMDALESAGVDNWQGYSDAMEYYSNFLKRSGLGEE